MTKLREHTQLPRTLESLLEARTADAVFVVGPDYRIVHWDTRAESLTGLLAEEMVGSPCYEALQGECEGSKPFGEQLCSVMRLAEDGRSVPGYDVCLFTRSGGKRWVNVSTLIVDTDDEELYLVHLVCDSQKAHDTLEVAQGLIRLSSSEKGARVPDRRDVPELTPRQLEVLELLAAGRLVKEIGERLYLSQATVRNHVRSLLQALGAHSQLEALAKARKVGLLSG